jgi:membrane protease YdiL (CAAX protease family)
VTGPLLVVGIAVQAVAWRLIAIGRARFWPTVVGVWAIVALASIAVGDPRCCSDRSLTESVAVGLGSGIVTTRLVVTLATTWPVVARTVDATYRRGDDASSATVWLSTLAIVVPGEELFWRGVATPWLGDVTSTATGAALAWVASVGVAAAWASLPFLAATVVGGAVWTAIAVWSGGVVAPLASHIVWTACMLAWRPPERRAKVAT